MKKEVIKIPANIKYLTEREKFIEEFGKPFDERPESATDRFAKVSSLKCRRL